MFSVVGLKRSRRGRMQDVWLWICWDALGWLEEEFECVERPRCQRCREGWEEKLLDQFRSGAGYLYR